MNVEKEMQQMMRHVKTLVLSAITTLVHAVAPTPVNNTTAGLSAKLKLHVKVSLVVNGALPTLFALIAHF